jgi:hypothetical protein
MCLDLIDPHFADAPVYPPAHAIATAPAAPAATVAHASGRPSSAAPAPLSTYDMAASCVIDAGLAEWLAGPARANLAAAAARRLHMRHAGPSSASPATTS